MWRAAQARPGEWLCMLGSTLALVASFLPYFGIPPVSLWQSILLSLRPEYASTEAIVTAFLTMQLLLLSMSFLACFATFLLPQQWNILPVYQMLSGLALGCYVCIACAGLFFLWVGAQIASEPLTAADLGLVLGLVHIGAWLVPAGLILALFGGGKLLKQREMKAGG